MYVPGAFRLDDPAALRRLVDEHPLATLLRLVDGEPVLADAPLYLDGTTLVGHLARGNPFARRLDGADLIVRFRGPDAYVSPTWYGTPAEHVPTWNYVVAEARGRAEVVAPAEVLARMVAAHEPTWRPDPAVEAQLSAGIVAFRMAEPAWTGKAKLSQNRSAEDHARVAGRITPDVAAWMRLG